MTGWLWPGAYDPSARAEILAAHTPEEGHDGDGNSHFYEGKRTLKLLSVPHSRNYNTNGISPSLPIFPNENWGGAPKKQRRSTDSDGTPRPLATWKPRLIKE